MPCLHIKTLRTRADFLRLRRARFYRTPGFMLRIAPMPETVSERNTYCRVGYTVSKHCSKKAVIRNRIKRRLREVVRACWPEAARDGYDYVLIARIEAHEMDFTQLKADARRALKRLHQPQRPATTPIVTTSSTS